MSPGVDVLIVNFNAEETLAHCVHSVLAQPDTRLVTVADNASTDTSIEALEELYGHHDRVLLRRYPDNPGLAAAVNRVLTDDRRGAGEKAVYLLLVNPDCELSPGALKSLRQALEADEKAALAAPMVVDGKGAPQRGNLRRFPDPWRSLLQFSGLWLLGRWVPVLRGVERPASEAEGTTRAEAVSGACMLLRRSVFEELGGLDAGYALHCEDLDLMYRLRQAGHYSLFVPSARVYHRQGVSSGSRPLWVHWQKHRGMQRFFLKFQAPGHGRPFRWLVRAGIWARFVLTLPRAMARR